ncbi:uncharacterized protein METZ01_LOCUS286453, partial [marine metagenome]
ASGEESEEEGPVISEEPPVFVRAIGTSGTGDGRFALPRDVAMTSDDSIYVADTNNHRVQKFDPKDEFVWEIGAPGNRAQGSGDGAFNYPFSVTVAANGNFYVADKNNYRIQEFTSAGAFVRKWGSPGTDDGEFSNQSPRGVAVAPTVDGNVYVADTFNDRIQKFDKYGVFEREWGTEGTGDGEFNNPRGVAVASDGSVYVADTQNSRIQKFDANGVFVTKWGAYGIGDGSFFQPRCVVVASDSTVYVADTYNDRIQRFTSEGVFVSKWGTEGTGDGEFKDPRGVAVASNGNVYVTDYGNHRIQVFEYED